MKIRFQPDDKTDGIKSQITWENCELQARLREAFHTSEREELYQLDIDRYGLTAYFKPKNS